MKTKYTLLVLSMLAMQHPAWALETLEDTALSDISGADGIVIQTQSDQVAIDQLYYQDKAGTSATGGVEATDSDLFARFDNINIRSAVAGDTLGSTIKINTGSNGATSAFNLSLVSKPSLFYANRFYACTSGSAACDANSNSGEWAIKSSGLGLDISSTNGLFNKSGSANIKIVLDQMDVFITQPQSNDPTKFNQIILGDIRANIDATGKIWVDAVEGIRFNGTVNLTEGTVNGQHRAGLQFALKQKNDVGNASTADATRYNSSNAGNLLRMGLSGTLNNVDVSVRGINDTDPNSSKILGKVDGSSTGDSIVGSSGIGLSVKGDIGNNFKLEIGESDTNTATGRSLQFTDISSLSNAGDGVGTFNLGNIYINEIATSKVALPVSSRLSSQLAFNTTEAALADANGLNYLTLQRAGSSTVAGGGALGAPSTVTAGMLSVAMRGASIQALPNKTNIINNATGAATTTINGGLVTAFNNLNGNIIFYGDNNQAGFGLSLSTEGLSSDGKSTTSLLIADTRAGKNRYIGLRNLDLLLQTSGTISMDGQSIRVALPNALLAFSGEIAAGNLMNGTTTFKSDDSSGNSKQDVLFGLRGKLEGAATVNLVPNASGALGIKVDIDLKRVAGDRMRVNGSDLTTSNTRDRSAGSFLHIIEPSDGSVLGLENISGKLSITGANYASDNGLTLDIVDDGVIAEGKIRINGSQSSTGVRDWGDQSGDLRIGNIAFYTSSSGYTAMPSTSTLGAPQRLGEIAMPGGEIYAKLSVKLSN